MILALYLTAQFFRIYLDAPAALLVSFLFLFFPSHDSTVYAFMNQYLTLSFAFYLYAFYLAYRNRLILSFLSALIASFVSYGSTPIAVALFALFILSKNFKKAAVIIIPNIIYSVYFVFLTIFRGIGHPRILEAVSVSAIAKQYLFQVLTFADAILGPSMWLKIYYSFFQLSLVSFMIGVILVIVCYEIIKRCDARYDPKLLVSFSILVLLSFLIFAATGRYPQICFNLGDRTTIYGSLLLAYLVLLMPAPKKVRLLILGLFIFTILGISDHWKNWNIHQQKVILNMKENIALKNYRDTEVLYVAGNQYSKYGPVSHIEFLSESWVPNSIFDLLFGRRIQAGPINKRFRYADGYLIDTKYNSRTKVDGYINVYDSEKAELFRVSAESINDYIESLPYDRRHWVQFLDNRYVKEAVLKLMPRLRYAI